MSDERCGGWFMYVARTLNRHAQQFELAWPELMPMNFRGTGRHGRRETVASLQGNRTSLYKP